MLYVWSIAFDSRVYTLSELAHYVSSSFDIFEHAQFGRKGGEGAGVNMGKYKPIEPRHVLFAYPSVFAGKLLVLQGSRELATDCWTGGMRR